MYWKARLAIAAIVLPGVFAFVLVREGLQGQHEAQAFKQPVVLTPAQFFQQRPREGWFTIKNAYLDVFDTVEHRASKTGPLKAIYVPIRDAADPRTSHKDFLIKVRSGPTVALYEELHGLPDTREAIGDFGTRHSKELSTPKSITGMIEAGMDLSGETAKRVAKAQGVEQSQLLILDEGRVPRAMGASLAKLWGGAALGVVTLIGAVLAVLLKLSRR